MKKQDDEVAALERPPEVPEPGKWTPIRDGCAMPGRGKKVLVSVRGHVFCAIYKGGQADIWTSENGLAYVNGRDVKAWQPTPPAFNA